MNQYFRCRLINLLEEIILSKNINKGKNLKKVRDLYQEIKNFENKTKFMKNLLSWSNRKSYKNGIFRKIGF